MLGFFGLTVISACGGSEAPSEVPSEPGNSGAPSYKLTSDWTRLRKVASAPRRVLIPRGPPPKEVIARDLKNGHGPVLRVGDSLTVNYASFSYSGELLEKRWGKESFNWAFDPGRILKGWVVGLKKMRVGGRRELIIPSRLAYRDGPRIYVIELLKVD